MSRMSPKQLIETVRAVLAATKNGTGPIAVVVNNNQPGTQHIVETATGVTLDVGTKLYASAAPEALRSREIFREAFSHISMHMGEDGPNYSMPRDEWDNHASVQDAIAEEHRLCGTAPSVPSPPRQIKPCASCTDPQLCLINAHCAFACEPQRDADK